MISIDLGLSPEAQVLLSRLAALTTVLETTSERALDEAAAAILSNVRTNYLAESAPDGTPWIPSAAGARRKSQGGGQTLFDTGNLFRSIQVYTESLQRQIGTDVPYAPYVQNGKTPRVFLAVTEQDILRTEGIFILRIEEALREQGL